MSSKSSRTSAYRPKSKLQKAAEIPVVPPQPDRLAGLIDSTLERMKRLPHGSAELVLFDVLSSFAIDLAVGASVESRAVFADTLERGVKAVKALDKQGDERLAALDIAIGHTLDHALRNLADAAVLAGARAPVVEAMRHVRSTQGAIRKAMGRASEVSA